MHIHNYFLFIKLKLIKDEFIHLQKPTQRNYFIEMLYEFNRVVVCCWGIFGTTEYCAWCGLRLEFYYRKWSKIVGANLWPIQDSKYINQSNVYLAPQKLCRYVQTEWLNLKTLLNDVLIKIITFRRQLCCAVSVPMLYVLYCVLCRFHSVLFHFYFQAILVFYICHLFQLFLSITQFPFLYNQPTTNQTISYHIKRRQYIVHIHMYSYANW